MAGRELKPDNVIKGKEHAIGYTQSQHTHAAQTFLITTTQYVTSSSEIRKIRMCRQWIDLFVTSPRITRYNHCSSRSRFQGSLIHLQNACHEISEIMVGSASPIIRFEMHQMDDRRDERSLDEGHS